MAQAFKAGNYPVSPPPRRPRAIVVLPTPAQLALAEARSQLLGVIGVGRFDVDAAFDWFDACAEARRDGRPEPMAPNRLIGGDYE